SGTVPFSASIPFTAPHYAAGTFVLMNDNPSGLPQNAKSLNVPIVFKDVAPPGGNGSGGGTGVKQGIRGTVLLGPICPVERIPPDPQCADKPYAASLVVTAAD